MKRGFTLIELLAVVIIVGVLSSMAIPQYRRSLERSRVAEAQEMLPAIYDSWQRYSVENLQKTMTPTTFDLLDISMKGVAANNSWKTANFIYNMVQEDGVPYVTAEARKGKYIGTLVKYDGESFTCVESDTNPGGCSVFNLAVFSDYGAY